MFENGSPRRDYSPDVGALDVIDRPCVPTARVDLVDTISRKGSFPSLGEERRTLLPHWSVERRAIRVGMEN